MMASIIKENLKIFSHTTSVKGIPKIFKSTLVTSKILWILATVSCLAVAGYNVYILTAGYMDRQTITTMTEMPRTSAYPYQMTTLVCDNQPYNVKFLERLGIPLPAEYFAKLRQVLSQSQDGEDTDLIKLIAEELFSSTGYRQYLTREEMALLTNSQSHLVASCHYLRREGLFTQYIKCNESNMAILKTTVPGFFNCYVLENKLAKTDMHIVGLQLLLYLEGVNKVAHTPVENTHEVPLRNFQKIGATVLAIPYATAQMLAKTSVQVIPGRDTDLKIAAEVRRRLEPPWGTCLEQDYLEHSIFGNGNEIVYTMDACMDECYEMALFRKCGCRDVISMGLMTTKYADVIFCGDIKMGYDWLVKNMSCMYDVRENFVESCADEKCLHACKETTFFVTSSAAQWPQPLETIPFYYIYMKGTSTIHQSFLDEYDYSDQKPFNETDSEDLDRLFYFIRQRFTKLTLFFPSETYTEYADHIKTSPSQLLSQVGALLNFWTGITVLLFVELADCVLKMMNQWSQKRREDRLGRDKNTNIVVVSPSSKDEK